MFNVFLLLLDDVLSKFVVKEVVLFSIVSFKTLTFYIGVSLLSWLTVLFLWLTGDHFVGKLSAVSRPTEPSIIPRSANE